MSLQSGGDLSPLHFLNDTLALWAGADAARSRNRELYRLIAADAGGTIAAESALHVVDDAILTELDTAAKHGRALLANAVGARIGSAVPRDQASHDTVVSGLKTLNGLGLYRRPIPRPLAVVHFRPRKITHAMFVALLDASGVEMPRRTANSRNGARSNVISPAELAWFFKGSGLPIGSAGHTFEDAAPGKATGSA